MDRRFHDNFTLNKLSKDPPAVYRYTFVGKALRESLTELLRQQKINPFLESHILKVFDHQMTESLSQISKVDHNKRPIQFRGKGQEKHTFIDGAWEMHITDVTICPNSPKPIDVKKMKIIADNWSDKSVEQRKVVQALNANKTSKPRRKKK